MNKRFWLSAKSMPSAKRLFKKCAKIGTKILSVFRYKIAMHIANMNAEVIEPKVWREANNREVIKIANFVGTNNFNLFNITPLNISSSQIGDMTMIAMTPKAKFKELFIYTEDKGNLTKKFKAGNVVII